jgi:hypothetical protein
MTTKPGTRAKVRVPGTRSVAATRPKGTAGPEAPHPAASGKVPELGAKRVLGGAVPTIHPADQAATDKEAAIAWAMEGLRVAATREMAGRKSDRAEAPANVAERMLAARAQIEECLAFVAHAPHERPPQFQPEPTRTRTGLETLVEALDAWLADPGTLMNDAGDLSSGRLDLPRAARLTRDFALLEIASLSKLRITQGNQPHLVPFWLVGLLADCWVMATGNMPAQTTARLRAKGETRAPNGADGKDITIFAGWASEVLARLAPDAHEEMVKRKPKAPIATALRAIIEHRGKQKKFGGVNALARIFAGNDPEAGSA